MQIHHLHDPMQDYDDPSRWYCTDHQAHGCSDPRCAAIDHMDCCSDPRYRDVGGRVLRLRKMIGWSRSDLARRAKLSLSAVAMVERGERLPNVATARKLSKALNVDPLRFAPIERHAPCLDEDECWPDVPMDVKEAWAAVDEAGFWHYETLIRVDRWQKYVDDIVYGEWWHRPHRSDAAARQQEIDLLPGEGSRPRRRRDLSPISQALRAPEEAYHRAAVRYGKLAERLPWLPYAF